MSTSASIGSDSVARVSGIIEFMLVPFLAMQNLRWRVWKETKNLAGESPLPDSDPFSDAELEKSESARQGKTEHE